MSIVGSVVDEAGLPDDMVQREYVERLRFICSAFPEVVEQQAWVGTRWRIRTATFAHVLVVINESPASYARAIESGGTATVLTFSCPSPEIEVLEQMGRPFFRVPWSTTIAGVVLTDGAAPDWDEIAELLTESYCLRAPHKLARQVERPGD